MLFDFFIIIGDKRFEVMANLLVYKNFKVLVYKTNFKNLNKKIKQTNSIKFGIKNAKNVICSIPFTDDFILIKCEFCDEKIYIKDLLRHLSEKNTLFAGCIPKKVLKICEDKSVFAYDYFFDYNFATNNSIATAEASIAIAILKNPVNMHSSNCLVLGFGNCGKLICDKLKNLCSNVFVCTDDEKEKAWAKAFGFYVFGLNSLRLKLEKFNYIFNTIPKKIFDADVLDELNENVFILDITKVGVDEQKCLEKKVNFERISGIPGKFKSKSCAEILTDLTLRTINKIKF